MKPSFPPNNIVAQGGTIGNTRVRGISNGGGGSSLVVQYTPRRARATLAIKSVDFAKLWTTLERDLTQVLTNPFNVTLKNDIEKLHNIVYKLSTGQCFNLPEASILSQNPHSTNLPQDGDIQPYTLYFMFKRLISNYLKQLISKLNTLSGISLLKHY